MMYQENLRDNGTTVFPHFMAVDVTEGNENLIFEVRGNQKGWSMNKSESCMRQSFATFPTYLLTQSLDLFLFVTNPAFVPLSA